ncbi:MAG: hypothetical protein WC955_01815 [Elusimicrobiota bacterium]
MRRIIRLPAILILTLLLYTHASIFSFADISSTINFQARLTDTAGQPLTDTTGLTFKLYDTLTGGTAKWTEVHNSVSVVNGMANVILGSYTVLTPSLFDTETWIEIMVGNDVLSPRQKISAVPYAIVTENSKKLSGHTYDMFISTGGGKVTGNIDVEGEIKSLSGGTTFYMVPRGTIVIWSGTISSIPTGWALCDGINGTPDLRDRFLLGMSSTDTPGIIGGTTTHIHVVPGHLHSVAGLTTNACPTDRWMVDGDGGDDFAEGSHSHTISAFNTNYSTVTITGINTQPHLPPYYKIAFIMKL